MSYKTPVPLAPDPLAKLPALSNGMRHGEALTGGFAPTNSADGERAMEVPPAVEFQKVQMSQGLAATPATDASATPAAEASSLPMAQALAAPVPGTVSSLLQQDEEEEGQSTGNGAQVPGTVAAMLDEGGVVTGLDAEDDCLELTADDFIADEIVDDTIGDLEIGDNDTFSQQFDSGGGSETLSLEEMEEQQLVIEQQLREKEALHKKQQQHKNEDKSGRSLSGGSSMLDASSTPANHPSSLLASSLVASSIASPLLAAPLSHVSASRVAGTQMVGSVLDTQKTDRNRLQQLQQHQEQAVGSSEEREENRGGEEEEEDLDYEIRVVYVTDTTIALRTTWGDNFEVIEEILLATGDLAFDLHSMQHDYEVDVTSGRGVKASVSAGASADDTLAPAVNDIPQVALPAADTANGVQRSEAILGREEARLLNADSKDKAAVKVEAAKVEAAKVEAAKVEAAKLEEAKLEAAKLEAAKLDVAKLDIQIWRQQRRNLVDAPSASELGIASGMLVCVCLVCVFSRACLSVSVSVCCVCMCLCSRMGAR